MEIKIGNAVLICERPPNVMLVLLARDHNVQLPSLTEPSQGNFCVLDLAT